jgi:geranylgeranyl diphosphate synthase type I
VTRQALPSTSGELFDELLAQRDLDPEQISFMQQTIVDSGALAKTERMIEELADESLANLAELELDEYAKGQLQDLALKVINRAS